MSYSNAPSDSAHSVKSSIETLTTISQIMFAIIIPLAYWFLVGVVIAATIVRHLTPVIIDLGTAWISDQMGYTKGYFVETVERHAESEAPSSLTVPTVADLTDVATAEPETITPATPQKEAQDVEEVPNTTEEFVIFTTRPAELTAYTTPYKGRSTRSKIRSLTC